MRSSSRRCWATDGTVSEPPPPPVCVDAAGAGAVAVDEGATAAASDDARLGAADVDGRQTLLRQGARVRERKNEGDGAGAAQQAGPEHGNLLSGVSPRDR